MYDARRLAVRGARTICFLAVAAALIVAVLPVAPASASSLYGAVYGWAQDASTLAWLQGIKVQAFLVGGGAYTPEIVTYTDATGNYALLVPRNTTCRIVFTDPHSNPHQVYADSVYNGRGYLEAGTDIPIAANVFSFADAQMHRASLIDVSVHRSGQWSTPLKGMTASIQDVADLATRTYKTDSNGSVLRGGVPSGAYRVTISDPSGKFGGVTVPSVLTHALPENDEWIVDGSMPLLNSSANIVVSKPSCNSSVKHRKKLSVRGTLSKRISKPKTMRLDAYQWSPSAMAWVLNAHSSLKIRKSGKKSAYSGSIRLPHAGKWRLVAVFTGSSAYAQSGSTYRGVKVN
jgi:hypothetical protein